VTGPADAPAAARLAAFAASATPPAEARSRAAAAVVDTIGVTLAGAGEPAARAVQHVVQHEHHGGQGPCRVLGAGFTASAGGAALANGTAAHAIDYDDMCFVSLAHPSAPLVSAVVAVAEETGASGRALLDAYVIGFEVEARLGRAMNPSHYKRGWHCTSTVGVMGVAAAVSRLLGLDATRATHALAIAASSASGVKENFGTMVKPLHAGLAARGGAWAAFLAARGLTGSERAIDGTQGLLQATDGESFSLADEVADLGHRWEILDTGITVKLYPSCAGTHPALDAILDLRRAHGFTDRDVEHLDVGVDALTPTILIHDRPATDLEAKFSMPFCAAAAIVFGRLGIDTFEPAGLADARVRALMPRVEMRFDDSLDRTAPALTQSRVRIRLRDGRILEASANGARGYPNRPATADELAEKFLSCARRTIGDARATRGLAALASIETTTDVRGLIAAF
jgi:2-methylcitrate dehydratase PrpD